MKPIYFKLILLTCLGIAHGMAAMEMPEENNNKKRKELDSQIELPAEKKNKIDAVILEKNTVCPICQEEAQNVCTEDNVTATSCCSKFMCQACFDTLQDKAKEMEKLIADPTLLDQFTQENEYTPHKLTEAKCPLCRYQAESEEDMPFSLRAATFTINNIFNAIKSDDMEAVKKFLKPDFDINATDSKQNTPLHIASCLGHEQIINLLLDHGANINCIDAQQLTPLQRVCKNNMATVASLLLKRGANINYAASYENTPIQIACENNSSSTVEQLLKFGAKGNLDHLFFLASYLGHHAIVELLLKSGANIKYTGNGKVNALHNACSNNHPSIIQILLKYDATLVNCKDTLVQLTPLHWACNFAGLEAIQELLKAGASVNLTNDNNATPLLVAIDGKRDIAIIAELLKAGADPNIADNKKDTPLHIACKKNPIEHVATIKELCKYKASLNVQDNKGYTPLHYICANDNENLSENKFMTLGRIIGLFILTGADYNCKNNYGKTPNELLKTSTMKEAFQNFKEEKEKRDLLK